MSVHIDLRSDTVTRPSREMREAMFQADVGDDVYGEDPTVNRLEEMVAQIFGKESALFVPTGVMGNQLCLKALTQPGDEVIIGKNSHIFNYETAAPSLLSGLQLYTVSEEDGKLLMEEVKEAIREEAYYLPRTAVIAQEQTHNKEGGSIIPIDHLTSISTIAKEASAASHLDGARIWNAIAESGISAATFAASFDTVSVCFSKGLGTPIGSALVGSAEVVTRAHRFRKIWGGGWRQAGMLAAACIYALENNVGRLRDDHEKARVFHAGLTTIQGIEAGNRPDTNIVIFKVPGYDPAKLTQRVAEKGVLLSAAFKGAIRAVFHMDVSMQDAEIATEIISTTFTEFRNDF